MGKYGTNLEGFGAFEGGVNADKGAPLVSTSSDGETALLFGPAALREIQAGVANGDFAIPPDAAGDTITAENPLPYWTFTDVNSAGAITCAIETASSPVSASGNVLLWTVAANTPTDKTATISRYVPVPSSRDEAYSSWLELTAVGDNHTDRKVTISLRFYTSDFQALGTEITRTFSFADFTTTRTGTFLYGDTSTRLIYQSTASFVKITISIETTGTNASQSKIRFFEVKILTGQPMLLISPRTRLVSAGPASIWKESDALYISADIPTTASSLGVLSTTRPYIKLDGSAITVGGDLTATGSITAGGANSLYVSRASVASAAQSLTNNTSTTILLDTASTTPTTGTYDPKSWFNNANDRIAVGQAGFYCITANIAFAANATGRRIVEIRVNGSEVAATSVLASPAGSSIISATTNLYLAAGDLVTMNALQQSGGALNTVVVAGFYPALSVGRIGA
jgi:hypothetical protein